jgi:hypothetical protein
LRRFVVRHAQNLLRLSVVASEHPIHTNGDARIDALAIDRARRPVIIEFKRVATGTAICQTLFYLDWLTSHRDHFSALVMNHLGAAAARRIDWSAPRIVCIAEAIGEREEAVARQVGKPVELIVLRRLPGGLVLLQRPAIATWRPD